MMGKTCMFGPLICDIICFVPGFCSILSPGLFCSMVSLPPGLFCPLVCFVPWSVLSSGLFCHLVCFVTVCFVPGLFCHLVCFVMVSFVTGLICPNTVVRSHHKLHNVFFSINYDTTEWSCRHLRHYR